MRASRARRTAVGAVCLLGLVPAAVACTSDSDPAADAPAVDVTGTGHPPDLLASTAPVGDPAFRSTVEEWNAFSEGPEVHPPRGRRREFREAVSPAPVSCPTSS